MVTNLKRLPQNGREIFARYTSRGLIANIYRELKKLNYQKINDPVKKWPNELNRAFSVGIDFLIRCLSSFGEHFMIFLLHLVNMVNYIDLCEQKF
jgi:hypothetical protein